MGCEGETWSFPGLKPEGLGGQTKSKLGEDLGVHKIGTSEQSKDTVKVILVLRYNRYKMAP